MSLHALPAKPMAHSPDGDSWTRWVHQVRSLEFSGMMEYLPLSRDAIVLELGCGDGFQLELLRQRFRRVLAIDPSHRPADPRGFAFAFAEALPFADSSFDLVVSNCVLEHLEDRPRGMAETARVLRPGGYAAHVVPARFWKTASLLFNPVGYPLRVAEKWWAMRQIAKNGEAAAGPRSPARRPAILQVLGRWFCPPIHGTYASHWAEYRAYGRDEWLASLASPQLLHLADAPLICATQFGFARFRLIAWRKWLGRHGFACSRVVVMQKAH